jgi:hypothetical protein
VGTVLGRLAQQASSGDACRRHQALQQLHGGLPGGGELATEVVVAVVALAATATATVAATASGATAAGAAALPVGSHCCGGSSSGVTPPATTHASSAARLAGRSGPADSSRVAGALKSASVASAGLRA